MEHILCKEASPTRRVAWRRLLASLLLVPSMASAIEITVNSPSDSIAEDDFCTLREAIINANNNDQSGSTDCLAGEASPTKDIISFSGATNAVPMVLSRTGISENAAATGDLDITESVIINGNGSDGTTVVDGNGTDRVFDIRNDAEVEMYDISVTNGAAVQAGAGINVLSGRLDLQDVRVHGNHLDQEAASSAATGAGIRTLGVLRLLRVRVEDNHIRAIGGRNGYGAGISVESGGSVGLSSSVVSNNTIETDIGYANGAGISNAPGALVDTNISSTIFSGNRITTTADGVASGGAINHQQGTLAILRGAFINNVVRRQSGLGTAVASGGAIASFGPVTMRNSTVSGNRVESVDDAAWGGGLSFSGGESVTLNNVTVTRNRVQTSGGGATNGGGVQGGNAVILNNTVIAGNTSSNNRPDCYSTLSSNGYNFIGNNQDCAITATTGDQIGDVAGGGDPIDARLARLADYGGSITIAGQEVAVLTHAPLADSPLIDAADPNTPGSGGTCESLDQLGFGRPVDGDEDGAAVCDIGAVEYSDLLPPPPSSATFFDSGSSGGAPAPVLLLLLAVLLPGRTARFRGARR